MKTGWLRPAPAVQHEGIAVKYCWINNKRIHSQATAEQRAERLRRNDHRSVHAYACADHWHVGHNNKAKRECRGCKAERRTG